MKTVSRIPELPTSSYYSMNRWFYKMYLEGLLFHVDDLPETIVKTDTGEPTFTPSECVKLNAVTAIMFEHHGDEVYTCGIKYFYKAMGIRPDCNEDRGEAQ